MTSHHAIRTLAPQSPPPGIYASKYAPEIGARICHRLAAGETLKAICRDDPSMPTEKTVWNWARAHPEFAAWRAWALTQARRRKLAAHAAREAARQAKWAAGGSAGSGKFAGGRGGGGRPAWNRGRTGYDDGRAQGILAALCVGASLAEACRDPDMPSVASVYNWLRARPEFQAAYRRAREVGADYLVTVASEAAPWLETEHASIVGLRRARAAAYGQGGKRAPRTFADGSYGPPPREDL